MKKLVLLAAIVPAILAISACKINDKDNSEVKTDSLNTTTDTTTKLSISVEKADSQFTVDAAGSSIAEVALGKLAQQKAIDRRIKNFGTMMIKNHSKLKDSITALAAIKKIAIPAVVDANVQKELADLAKKAGNDFDKAYIKYMIDNHKKDISTFEAATKKCQDPDIKAFAVKTLPTLRTHLDAINAIKEGMN